MQQITQWLSSGWNIILVVLGLAIVHRIVSDYNGEILVTSAPGAGTTVTVRMPSRMVAVTA